ncbi:hypothetical protein CAL27_11125 [Bordetella genomosp. 1]|uniref:Uncharacterized protein n=1 Tax=Bordetella genomosp. 1 TaxID=1395607 RepID=A0ABX4F0Q6_9BORD|nr:hypothetical protein CAL27_11125 [Bordetella genomosp. 1]
MPPIGPKSPPPPLPKFHERWNENPSPPPPKPPPPPQSPLRSRHFLRSWSLRAVPRQAASAVLRAIWFDELLVALAWRAPAAQVWVATSQVATHWRPASVVGGT